MGWSASVDISEFNRAFRDGEIFPGGNLGDFRIECRVVGDLAVPTGSIVACDPFTWPGWQPFLRQVPPGTYPVVLSIGDSVKSTPKKPEPRRIAFARLQIGTGTPIRWELATLPGQELEALKPGKSFGYPTDSCMGCFMDSKAGERLAEMMDDDPDNYATDLGEGLISADYAVGRWGNFQVDSETGLNVVFFDSAWGDGSYSSYWGFDDADEVVCLMTNFFVSTD
jgi:hypothetical protein